MMRVVGICCAMLLTVPLCADKRTAEPDKAGTEAIRQQIAKYTAAVDAADTNLASQVWQTSAAVSFIHPTGHAHGWDEVKSVYNFFATTFSERKLTVRDVSIHINGGSAWVEFYWHFVATQRTDGATVQTDGRETQIYTKAGNRWQLVHAHYSATPTAAQ